MYTEAEAKDQLRTLLPKGSEIYTIVRHVSSSGMSRRISAYMVEDGKIRDLDFLLIRAGFGKRRGDKDGLFIQGCGMDMAFALVYGIATTLHDDGYSITKRSL